MTQANRIRNLINTFPSESFTVSDGGRLAATLTMPNGQGDLTIHDDGDEITLFLGDITHCHFSQDYLGDGKCSSEAEMFEEAIEYLRDLLSDQVVFYRARVGGSDGSIQRPSEEQMAKVMVDCHCFVWSKAIEPNTEQDDDGKASPAIS